MDMTTPSRTRRVVMTAAMVLLACCGSDRQPPSPTVGDGPGTATSAGTPGGPPPAAAGSPGSSSAPGGTSDADGSGQGSSAGSASSSRVPPVNDLGGVGANGRAILRGSIPRLVVEVDRQAGVGPSQEALDHLRGTLDAVTDKPGGIVFSAGNQFSSSRTSWTAADLRAAAAANRSNRSGGGTVVIYVLYVRGGFVEGGEQTAAIGLATNASEAALFPERWASLGAQVLGGARAIERAVLVHELGHLLGLVNLTYRSAIDHEDPAHPGHSRNQGSVMFHAVETTLIGTLFNGPPPDGFDAADRADLDGLRTGRY
jgi:hypothetical protein